MSTLKTVDDLRADALFRAGEPPTDEDGSFWDKSLEYINRVQQQLLLGGSIAAGRDLATSAGIYAHLVDLPITDWWWARKRGVFNTTALATGYTVSGTLTQGTTQTLTLTTDVTQEVLGWYVVISGQPTVYRVARRLDLPSQLLLDQPYVDDTVTDVGVTFAKIEYPLATDFLRFCSTPYRHASGGMPIDVGSIEQRNAEFTQPFIRQGRPSKAFMVGPRTLAVNGYDTRPYRFEYEYVAMPADLHAGEYPVLPEHHRAVLSSGAAMLMLFDKSDSRAANMASEYRELVGRMVQEHRKAIGGGSSTFGQFRFRKAPVLRRSPQPLGELYLF
jgi:hypothetical protein